MIEVNTIPTAGLNVSKVRISLNSAAEFSMQFSIVGWGQYPGPDGKAVWGSTPIVSTLLRVDGEAWTNWGKTPGETDSTYIGNLALQQLGLERDDTVVVVEQPAAEEPAAEEAPAEEAVEEESAE